MTNPRDGQHLILGRWQDADGQDAVDAAARAAEAAFPEFAALSRDARAGFLEAIADAIEARADAILRDPIEDVLPRLVAA